MSIEDKIIDLFRRPEYRYHGIPINVFGLPVFREYKRDSLHTALTRLKKKEYVKSDGDFLKLANPGKEYIKRKQESLQVFDSPFSASSPRTLLLMFDIPESRKAEREWLRMHLKKFGYAMIQKSVWVGPSPIPKEFHSYLKRINLLSCVKTFKLAKPYQKTIRSS